MAGDYIEAYNKLGQPVLKGTVLHVNPLRTVLSTDENYPVEVPNLVPSNCSVHDLEASELCKESSFMS